MGKTLFTLFLCLWILIAPEIAIAQGDSLTGDTACVLVNIETALPHDSDPSINKLKEWQSILTSERGKSLTDEQLGSFRTKEGLDSSLSDEQINAIYQIQNRWLQTRIDIETKRRLYSRISLDSNAAVLEEAKGDAMDHLQTIAPNDAPIAEIHPEVLQELIKTTMALTDFNEPLSAQALSALIQIHAIAKLKIQIRAKAFLADANVSEVLEQAEALERAQIALLSELPFKHAVTSLSEKAQKLLVVSFEKSTKEPSVPECCGRNCGFSCPYLVGVNPFRKVRWFLGRQLASTREDSDQPQYIPLYAARDALKDLIPKSGMRPPQSRSKKAKKNFVGSD